MISFRQYVTRTFPINELQYLTDLMSKKGNDFLDELLNRKTTINLKIDQAAFVVGNVGGEIKYFGREGKVEITKFRRQGADLYENTIKHLESRNISKIPKGTSVYMEFFDDTLPTLIRYASKPRNNLIISYIKQNGTILLPSHPLNKKMAELLDVSPPPVLFDGKLSSDQKKKLIEYVETPHNDLAKKYGGKNFTQFVLSMFVTPKTMTYLMTDKLEGLVFYFDDGKKIDMAKVNDPGFTADIKAKQNKDDSYHKLLMGMIYDDMEKVSASVFAGSYNKTNFAEKMTKTYIRRNHDYTRKLNAFRDVVTRNRFARLGFDLLPSSVLNMVEKKWFAEDIYRVLHFMFEKKKMRANPKTGLTKERKEMINKIVEKLRG